MKTNIVENIIKTDKLNEEIYRFELLSNQKAYIFMNNSTMECLKGTANISSISEIDSYKRAFMNSSCRPSGVIAVYNGRKIYENDDLKFGEIEIR